MANEEENLAMHKQLIVIQENILFIIILSSNCFRIVFSDRVKASLKRMKGESILIQSGKKIVRRILILLLSLSLLSCKSDFKYTDSRIAMGTSVSITIYDEKDKPLLADAFSLIYEIENKISPRIETSYVHKINMNAGISPVAVPEDVFSLVSYSFQMREETQGVFDPLVGALSELWAIGSDSPRVPSKQEIEEALPLLDGDEVVLDEADKTVFLKKEGMRLDLGGIGKGYAADCVRDFLLSNGVEKAIINLGGNIHVLGGKSESEDWKIGISDPANPTSYITLVDARDESVVTSGSYERFFIEDGKSYHHILDTKTGYPTESDLLSASVVAKESILADCLSTVVFASGSDKAEEIAKRFGVELIIYTKDGSLIRYGEP